MAYSTRTEEERWFLVTQPLSACLERWPEHKYNTLKGKRAYWKNKVVKNTEAGKMESYKGLRQNQEEDPLKPEVTPSMELAVEFLTPSSEATQSLLELYETQSDQVIELEYNIDKPSVKVMYLNELLIGHKDADIGFFTQVADNLPEDLDLIITSGMLQGDFKLLQKARRKSLRPGLDSMDKQFYYANQMLDVLAQSGKPVIYNMSNDDRRICEEYTIEQFRVMLDLANAADKVNYYQIDKMKTHPRFNDHFQFQNAYAFPYCLRAGRRLKTAEEMAEEHGVEVSEYLMLFDTIKRMEAGTDPIDTQYAQYIDVESLGDTNFTITDDANVTFKTQGAERKDWVRHNVNFSNEPMYSGFMNVPYETVGQLAASGEQTPSMYVLQHNLEEIGIQKDGTWITSGGGMLRARRSVNSKGSQSDIAGDQSKRLTANRRRIPSPSASAHERFDDGRHVVTIFNEKLMSKANSCERTALPLLTDWQIGSLTARPDLLIKYLDYIQTIPEQKVLYFNGDFVQGRNYPNYPNENQELGLISMDAQIQFVRNLLDTYLVNDGTIKKAFVTPGNHEWNSGTEKWHGYSFTQYVMDACANKGMDTSRGEGMITDKGEKFKAWGSVNYLGDYGVYVSHLPLLKGAKGGGGLPIYQAGAHSTGVGGAKKSIDFEMYGHWHHPQYALFGDKLACISGSLAGMSGYEWMRGYRPVISSVILHIGGGEAPQLEFLSEEFMENYKSEDNQKIHDWIDEERKKAVRGEYTQLR